MKKIILNYKFSSKEILFWNMIYIILIFLLGSSAYIIAIINIKENKIFILMGVMLLFIILYLICYRNFYF